ncbi:MAG: hypothetical protein QM831_31070 [Kofleriaceae bacterium]
MTGIVNITCPWCGGRVTGLQVIDHAQKIACPYCRTELHVPKVGESAPTGWGYRELDDGEIYVDRNDAGILTPSRKPILIAIAIVVMAVSLIAGMAGAR